MFCSAVKSSVDIDRIARKRKEEIRSAPDCIRVSGTSYFVRSDGDDRLDGRSPDRAWRTLNRVSAAELLPGDGVFFRRGDVFRGYVQTRSGVSYGAYGKGDKPKFYGWDYSLANPDLWELWDESHSIWKLTEPILDCGTLVFDEGKFHSRKLIPSYRGGRFVCREDESRIFDPAAEMTQDLDMVCFYEARMDTRLSKGESFPVPKIDDQSFGTLLLRCKDGNPGAVFRSVEAVPRRNLFQIKSNDYVTVDNLCIKYCGAHAIGASGQCVKGLHVSNCEIGWIGGSIQNYYGTDPNYPDGRRGSVTRYGNGVEIYGGCENYTVENCYIYQVYDAAITHQFTVGDAPCRMASVRYAGNLVERCVYSIEYFLNTEASDRESVMEDVEIRDNILRLSGYGWGQQRHNIDTPAHIKGWSYVNPARNFVICHNVFDRSAYRMLHLVAMEPESCPVLQGNTYIQNRGGPLGQYGSNAAVEPEILPFTPENVTEIFGDSDARICIADGEFH